MRKSILFIGALLLAGSAHAQLGFKAGAGVSTLGPGVQEPAREAKASAQTGFHAGVFYAYQLGPHFDVVPELQYSRQQADIVAQDYRVADGGYRATFRLRQQYLAVPVLLRAKAGWFFLEAGPQLAVLLRATEAGVTEASTIAGPRYYAFDRNATGRYRHLDVALNLGAGVRLPAGLALSVRASAGLLPVAAAPRQFGVVDDMHNRNLQAALSYQLPARR